MYLILVLKVLSILVINFEVVIRLYDRYKVTSNTSLQNVDYVMHDKISKLIGEKFDYQGETWIMVEVLTAEDAIVITPENTFSSKRIQDDQYGQARRRCVECVTLKISSDDGSGYSDNLLKMLAGHLSK